MKKKKTSFGNEKKLILVIIVISIVAFFHFSKQDTQISYSNYECQSGRSEMTREEWQRIYYFHLNDSNVRFWWNKGNFLREEKIVNPNSFASDILFHWKRSGEIDNQMLIALVDP